MLLFVNRFLVQKYPRAHFDFAALKPEHVTTFVRGQATELGSVQAKHMVTALRGFFRYPRQDAADQSSCRCRLSCTIEGNCGPLPLA